MWGGLHRNRIIFGFMIIVEDVRSRVTVVAIHIVVVVCVVWVVHVISVIIHVWRGGATARAVVSHVWCISHIWPTVVVAVTVAAAEGVGEGVAMAVAWGWVSGRR